MPTRSRSKIQARQDRSGAAAERGRGPEGRAEADNLVGIYAALAGTTRGGRVLREHAAARSSPRFKAALADLAVARLRPITAEMRRLLRRSRPYRRDPGGRRRARAAPSPRRPWTAVKEHRRLRAAKQAKLARVACPAPGRGVWQASPTHGDEAAQSYEAGHRRNSWSSSTTRRNATARSLLRRGAPSSTGGAVVLLLCVIDARPISSTGSASTTIMRAEADAGGRERRSAAIADTIRESAGLEPEQVDPRGQARPRRSHKLIDEDEDIAILVLAAGSRQGGPGPLVTALRRQGDRRPFPVPVAIVPRPPVATRRSTPLA